MSFAADNPEVYDELCGQGITDKMFKELGYSPRDDAHDRVSSEAFLAEINMVCPKAFAELCSWAATEIAEREAAWHTRGDGK